jgi:hypothetical protein
MLSFYKIMITKRLERERERERESSLFRKKSIKDSVAMTLIILFNQDMITYTHFGSPDPQSAQNLLPD